MQGWRITRVALVLIGVALLVLIGRVAGPALPHVAAWIERAGPWGPVAYIGGYVVACVALVPGALPTMAAGVLFGLSAGTLYAFVGETLGGVAAFLVARRVARPLVERRLAGTPRFAAIDRAVATNGRRIVFLLRLSPLFPFNFLNYALGITGVRLVDYTLASVAMLPGAFLYVYYGKLIGDVALLASGETTHVGAGYWALLGVGLVATIVVTTAIARLANQALIEATDPDVTSPPPSPKNPT
jgi:uncharacterized membrane protein YdjX (TVP38/TMEM64 family)